MARANVPIGLLKNASWNPPNRTAQKNLKTLADSMDKIGLLNPVCITKDRHIIEGHRRTAAGKLLGWKEIECNIIEGDPAEIYASVNSTPRKMAGNDALGVWLAEPNAVLRSMKTQFDKMESRIGHTLMRQIFKAGMSRRLFLTAIKICRYCDDETDESLIRVIEWFLEFPVAGLAMKAMENGESPATIMRAVNAKKPIKLKLAVA